MRVSFTIPGVAAEAIQIDERSLFPHGFLDSQLVRRGRGHQCNIVADVEVAQGIHAACVERGEPQGREGFDQPASWGAACRQAAVNIAAAIAKVTQ